MNIRLNFSWDIGGGVTLSPFSIENPPAMLAHGDPVNFKWEDYLSSPEQLEYLESIREEVHLKVHLVVKKFSRDELTIEYVLLET